MFEIVTAPTRSGMYELDRFDAETKLAEVRERPAPVGARPPVRPFDARAKLASQLLDSKERGTGIETLRREVVSSLVKRAAVVAHVRGRWAAARLQDLDQTAAERGWDAEKTARVHASLEKQAAHARGYAGKQLWHEAYPTPESVGAKKPLDRKLAKKAEDLFAEAHACGWEPERIVKEAGEIGIDKTALLGLLALWKSPILRGVTWPARKLLGHLGKAEVAGMGKVLKGESLGGKLLKPVGGMAGGGLLAGLAGMEAAHAARPLSGSLAKAEMAPWRGYRGPIGGLR